MGEPERASAPRLRRRDLGWFLIAASLPVPWVAAYQLGLGTHPEVRLVGSYEPRMVGSIGIGVRKGDGDLLARVNQSLARLKANGTIDRILGGWDL